jgi:hypothetical protein
MHTLKTEKLPRKRVERTVKDKLKKESLRIADMERLAVMSSNGSMREKEITVHQ